MKADWHDLTNMGFANIQYVGKTLVVIPKTGNLTFRKWASPFRILWIKNVQEAQIWVSLFRDADGHSLEEDIRVNVAQIPAINEFPTQ
jgi:hypothetical protein